MKHQPSTQSLKTGFTLIELLIVVSILAILTIIALPNFGEAQVRSKVAAIKNNMRNMATKMEMLNVDSNYYIVAGKWRRLILYRVVYWRHDLSGTPEEVFKLTNHKLYGPFEDVFEVTPLKQEEIYDAWWLGRTEFGYLCHGLNFFHPKLMIDALENGAEWEDCSLETWHNVNDMAGGWLLYSSGPDLTAETPGWFKLPGHNRVEIPSRGYDEKRLFHEYDPTNGTVSYGNIFRSQRNPAGLGTRSYFYETAEQ